MKFKMLINIEIAKIDGIFRFNSLEPAIYPANKYLNDNNCWHFNVYKQNKFHAQLSSERKKFYNLGARTFFIASFRFGIRVRFNEK